MRSPKPLKKRDIEDMLSRHRIDPKIHKQVTRMLYVNLLMYTKDDALSRVKINTSDLSFESLRHILAKGRNASIVHVMTIRNKVMHPEAAGKVSEIEKKLAEWKKNIRYLHETCPDSQMQDQDQLKTILISMMPESVADYLTQRY